MKLSEEKQKHKATERMNDNSINSSHLGKLSLLCNLPSRRKYQHLERSRGVSCDVCHKGECRRGWTANAICRHNPLE